MNKYLNKEFLLSNKEQIIKVAVIVIIIAVAFFVFVSGGDDQEMVMDTATPDQAIETQETDSVAEKIIVDVAGAVNNPKVVELEPDSRVADAIAAAGGLKEKADTTQINQAAFVTDGEKIYIPSVDEENEVQADGMSAVMKGSSKVDINTATSEELQTLNGVGPATAEKIISYRSDVGYFKNIEELKNVDGIGDKTFDNLKEYIMV